MTICETLATESRGNPVARDVNRTFPDGYVAHRLSGLRVLLNPTHGAWLRELSVVFDLVWATSWELDADRLIAPLLGLPTGLPVVTFEVGQAEWTVKLPAVASFVGERPLAWIDDRIGPDEEAWGLARRAPTLLIRPNHQIGITRADVDALLLFGQRFEGSRLPVR